MSKPGDRGQGDISDGRSAVLSGPVRSRQNFGAKKHDLSPPLSLLSPPLPPLHTQPAFHSTTSATARHLLFLSTQQTESHDYLVYPRLSPAGQEAGAVARRQRRQGELRSPLPDHEERCAPSDASIFGVVCLDFLLSTRGRPLPLAPPRL